MNLKKQMFASSTWTLTGNAGQQLLSFVIFIYLARLLSPEDFGFFALAAAFTDIAEMLVRWGQGSVLIQRRTIDDRIMSTAFWIVVALGIATALLMILMSAPAAAFFEAPKLTWVFAYMALLPGLSALGTVNDALIQRKLAFRSIAIRNVVAVVASGGVALSLAFAGYGIMALVAQRLTYAAFSTVLLVIAHPWVPRFVFDRAAARELIVHGGRIMWNGLSLRLSPRMLDFLVGYFLGPRALGLLRVSLRFFDFLAQGVLQPIADVLPAILRQVVDDMTAIRRVYRRLIILAATIFFPMAAGIGLMAEETTRLIFGDRWIDSIPLIEGLSFLAFTLPLSTFFAPVMLVLGQSRVLALIAILRILAVVAAAAVTAQFSVLYVVLGYVAGLYAVTWVSTDILVARIGLSRREIFLSQAPVFVATLAMGAAVLAIKATVFYQTTVDIKLQLAMGISAGALAYVATLLFGVYVRAWPLYAQEMLATLPALTARGRGNTKGPR